MTEGGQAARQEGTTVAIPAEDTDHREATHRRWVAHRNRRTGSAGYPEEWYGQQCGACWFYVPLAGDYGYDWGVCTNADSEFDRHAMFEHDGCDHHEPAGDWVHGHDVDSTSGSEDSD